jgi:Tfp pilus assembly protein PilX
MTRRHSGAALVITLAMLILVSFVVVAFLGRSTREAVLVSGAVGGQKADLLANSAAELIIADLKNEMRASSTENTTKGVTIMEPTSAAAAFPSQNRLAATTGTAYVNVLKQSGATGGMFTASGTKLISDNTTTKTTTASVDGRAVSEVRWNLPQLLVGGNFTAAQVPNWILMDRVGIAPSQTWNSNFTNRTPTNDSYIIGRFAYNIYDVSGLLDINVAGFPSSVTAADFTRKGSLAMAVLENIVSPSTINATTFVGAWRNKVSGGNSTNYLSYIGLSNNTSNSFYNLGPKYGFQKVTSNATASDNRLLSRQDLIRLAINGGNGIAIGALPYLTHFSRTVSAPTWSPVTPIGSNIDYNSIRNDGNSTNRFLSNVRVSGIPSDDDGNLLSGGTKIRRLDGTTFTIGQPLLKTRFPLSWLALLEDANPATNAWELSNSAVKLINELEAKRNISDAGNIPGTTLNEKAQWLVQMAFGLVWISTEKRWDYTGSPFLSFIPTTPATFIKILGPDGSPPPDTVCEEKREPNFFELLKAAILSGSLGKSFGDGLSAATANQTLLDSNKDRQIIQIGLNIIDQYDGNSYPTVCLFNGEKLYGIENLPYLNRVFMHFYRPPSPGPTTPTATTDPLNVNAYWIGEVWNPHRGTTPSPSTAGPTNFQFRIEGENVPISSNGGVAVDSNNATISPPGLSSVGNITFTNPGSSDPKFLCPPLGNTTTSINRYFSASSNKTITGIYAGTVRGILPSPAPAPTMTITSPNGLNFILEYQDGTQWVPYQKWSAIKPPAGLVDANGYRTPDDNTSPGCFIQSADPRSTRFGLWAGIDGRRNTTWNAAVLPPADLSVGLPSSSLGWTIPATSLNFGAISKNLNGSTTRYTDPDGTLRSGDAANSTTTTDPLLPGITSSRQVILNRPFRSVADLGYAFRDLPFKTLDLFTANSADSALLDVFCVNESSISGVTAGVLNPNSRHSSVLQAVLVNSLKNELNPAPSASRLTSTTEAPRIGNTTVSMTATTPFRNASEVASRLGSANLELFPLTDRQIKAYRESVVRALADVSNTRTWNVMVDLVVQSGRYANAATDVDKFTVDGERRMWVHLAIDRYTGQVIARSTEIVNE